MSGDKGKRNSVSRPNDHKRKDSKSKSQKDTQKPKDKDGDEEMTVVVPPSKGDAGKNEDVAMNGTDEAKPKDPPVDPKAKAIAGMMTRFFSTVDI